MMCGTLLNRLIEAKSRVTLEYIDRSNSTPNSWSYTNHYNENFPVNLFLATAGVCLSLYFYDDIHLAGC